MLWQEATASVLSQKGYLVVARGHNSISVVTERLFVGKGPHILLWQEATALVLSQKGYLR